MTECKVIYEIGRLRNLVVHEGKETLYSAQGWAEKESWTLAT